MTYDDDEFDALPRRVERTKFKQDSRYPHHRSEGTHARRAEKRMEQVARRTKKLGYVTVCLSCDGPIDANEAAQHEHGVGAWHADCDPPRNLSLYRRERDRGHRQRLPRHYYESFDDDA